MNPLALAVLGAAGLGLLFSVFGSPPRVDKPKPLPPEPSPPPVPPVVPPHVVPPTSNAGFPGVVLVKPNEPQPHIPAGYRRMKASEVSQALAQRARSFLSNDFGAVIPFTDDGRDLLAAIEQHFHEPGGPVKPWGWHKGVSLFIHQDVLA